MTTNDIIMSLTRAEYNARLNRDKHGINTILYFDEANASEVAIDLIKEIVCDGRAMGQRIDLADVSLKIISSCSPYRRYVLISKF